MEIFYPVIIALVFHAMDFLTGLVGAFRNKCLESSKMRDGLFKKIGYVMCYVLAYLIDVYGPLVGIELGVSILPIITAYAVLTECISIIENISTINPDLLPEKLMELFHLGGKNESKD